MQQRRLNNQRGQALVGILVELGIMGIFIAGMMAMFSTQNNEVRALNEKLAVADLEKLLIASLADGSVCGYVMNNPTSLNFNATKVLQGEPQTIAVNAPLYTSVVASLPGAVVAQIGQTASARATTVVIKSIGLTVTGGAGSSYLANWTIGFDNTKLVRPLKPVTVSTTLTVDASVPLSARIVSCQSPASSGNWHCAPGTTGWSCMRTTDGKVCASTPSTVAFACSTYSGWPSGGDDNGWQCTFAANLWGCFRPADTLACAQTAGLTWNCAAVPGLPN